MRLALTIFLLLIGSRSFARSSEQFFIGGGLIQSDNYSRPTETQPFYFGADMREEPDTLYVSFLSSQNNLSDTEMVDYSPLSDLGSTRYNLGFKQHFDRLIGEFDTRFGIGVCNYSLYGGKADSIRTTYLCYGLSFERSVPVREYLSFGLALDLTLTPQTQVGSLQIRPIVFNLIVAMKFNLPPWKR